MTISSARRRPYFTDPPLAQSVIRILLESATSRSFIIHAYCLMPDHIHILAESTCPTGDALAFTRLFKQRTGFHFRKTSRGVLWESSYYDHVLRKSDSLIEVARYIWWKISAVIPPTIPSQARKLSNGCKKPEDLPKTSDQYLPSEDWPLHCHRSHIARVPHPMIFGLWV